MTIAFITHPDCLLHEMGVGHPECPQRLQVIYDALIASGLDKKLIKVTADAANPEDLLRVHSKEHVDYIFDNAPQTGWFNIDSDTMMNPHTLHTALLAAGAAVQAVDMLMDKTADAAFCGIRPPGHHAERDRAMGFCFFNNIAVAAAHALGKHKLNRIAIVDFDVHHGNGTHDIFRDDDRVLFCSAFQYP